jgi:hypothetical protein
MATEGMTMNTTWRAASIVAALCLLGDGSAAESRADTPKFPDIDSYAPVDIADYNLPITTPGRKPFDAYYFATPDGVMCNFFSGQAQCRGNNFPAVPPAESSSYPGVQSENWIGTATGLKQTNSIVQTSRRPLRTLPPFHSIAVGGIICGVDDARTTACKDSKGRGFVLSPAWSGWLPKV